jgi:hypothetical protein
MSCLSTARKTRIQNRIDKLEDHLDRLYTAQENGDLHIESYSFDSGEGKQTLRYKSQKELNDAIDRAEAALDRNYNLLNGTGLMNMNQRRKNRSGN